MIKKFKEFVAEMKEVSGHFGISVSSHKEYEDTVKKHHPDAKRVEHKNKLVQHVVGAQQNVVGHWDPESGTGKVKKSHVGSPQKPLGEATEELTEAAKNSELPAGHAERGHVAISKTEYHKMLSKHKSGIHASPKGTMVHGKTTHNYTDDTHTSNQHYSHPEHGIPSVWEHYNRKTGQRSYSKKKD